MNGKYFLALVLAIVIGSTIALLITLKLLQARLQSQASSNPLLNLFSTLSGSSSPIGRNSSNTQL